jgi:hypothetical protein
MRIEFDPFAEDISDTFSVPGTIIGAQAGGCKRQSGASADRISDSCLLLSVPPVVYCRNGGATDADPFMNG